MAAACTSLQAALIDAACSTDAVRFLELSRRCDAFASATFVAPMEGYIRRMLWALCEDGVIPEAACHDPYGPPLDDEDRRRVAAAVRQLHEAGW
jgi:4-hydroxy-tetrahydrodipicolinate synthase